MTRSRKKPHVQISKAWDRFKEHAFRGRTKRACREAEIDFDPDSDFEELTLSNKKLGSWGTRICWHVPPGDGDDIWYHESYKEMKRK